MLKQTANEIEIRAAPKYEFETIRNLAQFYVYDTNCAMKGGHHWPLDPDGRYFEIQTLPLYWEEAGRLPFLIYYKKELAGFVLIRHQPLLSIDEFFILRKFNRQGIGQFVAFELFNRYPGPWELMVICENSPARYFWQQILGEYTQGHYTETTRQIPFKGNEFRFVFQFESQGQPAKPKKNIEINIDYHPDEHDTTLLSTSLYDSNVKKGMSARTPCWVLMKNHNHLLGGCAFYIFDQFVFIDEIWLHEDYQGQGYGREILTAAETEAKKKGCESAYLDTFSFQNAKGFYEKLGYQEIFQHPSLDGKEMRYFMKKKLL